MKSLLVCLLDAVIAMIVLVPNAISLFFVIYSLPLLFQRPTQLLESQMPPQPFNLPQGMKYIGL